MVEESIQYHQANTYKALRRVVHGLVGGDRILLLAGGKRIPRSHFRELVRSTSRTRWRARVLEFTEARKKTGSVCFVFAVLLGETVLNREPVALHWVKTSNDEQLGLFTPDKS